ncbi:MAG: ATP synthase F1 subunit epsilon [Negativicutes bacterium]|jgi:F-type H+-transporting ATPase subunit epsilon|nr:ATP synthase F1 subunit epsilon [Negativicutes bacterium]
MSGETFQIEILTPDRKVLDVAGTQIVVQTVCGSLGILARHTPMIAPLAEASSIRVQLPDKSEVKVAITGGVLEVLPRRVSILARVAELGSEIDLDRALRAKERAERRLAERQSDTDFSRAENALRKALVRLRIGGK